MLLAAFERKGLSVEGKEAVHRLSRTQLIELHLSVNALLKLVVPDSSLSKQMFYYLMSLLEGG